MAVAVITGAYVALNGSDRSSFVESVELAVDVDDVETTNMGSSGWKTHLGGLKSGTLTLNLQADYADSAIDDVLWGLLGTVVTFEIRPTSSAVSVNNPKYTGSVLISQHKAVPAQVGQKPIMQVSFPTSGAITRAEA